MVLVTPSKAFLILCWFKMIPPGPPSLVKQEKVGQCQVWGIGQVLQCLEPFLHHLLFYFGSSICTVDWCIVPVKLPLLLGHEGTLLLEVLQELVQDLNGVVGVDGGTSGDDVHIDEAPWLKKHHEHLFGLAGMHL
jgi:hypothetical protein